MLAEIYGSQPVWTPLRLMRAALIALVGGVVAGTHGASSSRETCLTCFAHHSQEPYKSMVLHAQGLETANFSIMKGTGLAPLPCL